MLYITSPWFTYFITVSLSLLIPFTYFTQPPTPTSGNHLSVLYLYELLWKGIFWFLLDFTYKWDHMIFFFLCLTYFTQYIYCFWGPSIVTNGNISFFLWRNNIPYICIYIYHIYICVYIYTDIYHFCIGKYISHLHSSINEHRLLWYLAYCKSWCNEHGCAYIILS